MTNKEILQKIANHCSNESNWDERGGQYPHCTMGVHIDPWKKVQVRVGMTHYSTIERIGSGNRVPLSKITNGGDIKIYISGLGYTIDYWPLSDMDKAIERWVRGLPDGLQLPDPSQWNRQ